MVADARWGWFRDIGYRPHRFQVPAHASLARIRNTCAGRRGGKTHWTGHEASAYMVAGPFDVAIFAPSYDLGMKEFDVIWDDLHHEANPYELVTEQLNPSAGNVKVALANGASATVISYDKPRRSGHGAEFDLIILSEAALSNNLGGESGVWNKTIVGAMASRKAEVIIPYTPQGQDEFLFPLFMSGLVEESDNPVIQEGSVRWREFYKTSVPHDPNVFSLQWPAYANPAGYMEDPVEQRRILPKRIYDEQVEGIFVRWSGSVWVNDFCYDDTANVCDIRSADIPDWWNRVEVIDPGAAGQFFWIAAVIDEGGNIYIVDEYAAQRTTTREHVEAILQRRRMFYGQRYNPDKFIPVFVDPTDQQVILDIAAEGLQATAANNDVWGGFNSGGIRFKMGTMSIGSHCKLERDGLKYHEWNPTKDEAAKRRERQDQYKHASDCIRYLCLAPVWPSEKPRDKQKGETVADMLASVAKKQKSVMDMSFDEWKRYHSGVAA